MAADAVNEAETGPSAVEVQVEALGAENIEATKTPAAPKTVTFMKSSMARWIIPGLVTMLSLASQVAVTGIFAKGDVVVTPATVWLRGLVLGYMPLFLAFPWIISLLYLMKTADDPSLHEIGFKPAAIGAAIIGVMQFLLMWTTLGWGSVGMLCMNFGILVPVVYNKCRGRLDRRVLKQMQDTVNALYVPAYGGLGIVIAYPYLAKEHPQLAGILLTVCLSALEGIGFKLLTMAGNKHFEHQGPFVVQGSATGLIATMDAFRFGGPFSSILKNPNETSWITALSSGIILNVMTRTGWFNYWMSNLIFRLTGKNLLIPGSLVWIQREAKFATGYLRLMTPLGLMLGRALFGSTQPWWISDMGLIFFSACLGQMVVEDCIVLVARRCGLEAKPNERMKKWYEALPPEKIYQRAFRWNSDSGEPEPAVNWDRIPFLLDSCVILATCGQVGCVVLGAVVPNVSNMCFIGLSSTCEASAVDGYFYWPIQS